MGVCDVLDVVRRDRIFYEESGGGVTFSGGEPFAQPAFLGALLHEAKRERLSTVVDTCGFTPRDRLLQLAPLVDLFLYDLKVLDPGRHEQLVGVPLAPILENLAALDAADARVWIRVPIVPSLTDDDAGLEAIARLTSRVRAVERVNLLPYHATGAGKCRRLGRDDALGDVVPPGAGRMTAIADLFRARGVDVRIGG
jgi:pyruvate formate lyase activating enzyme